MREISREDKRKLEKENDAWTVPTHHRLKNWWIMINHNDG
jgi:hypothetical protein